jgi:hypothetical protein
MTILRYLIAGAIPTERRYDMARLTDDMNRLSGEIEALRRAREAFIEGLRGSVVEIKREVAGMQAGFRNDHAEMARKTKEGLLGFHGEIKNFVSGLRDEVALLRTQEEVTLMAEEEEGIEAVFPDDLTKIKGIGPVMQERLNGMGIYAFAQLAKSTPEEIREALGESSKRLTKMGNWIKQAKKLAK